MRDSDSSLGHHLGEVAVARLIGDIPSDTKNDDCAIKVATAKQGRCVRKRLIHATDYQPNLAFAPEPFRIPPDKKNYSAELIGSMRSLLTLTFMQQRPAR